MAVERFHQELERVGGVFYRVHRVGEAAPIAAAIARERQLRRLVTWHPSALGADLGAELRAQGLEVEAMPAGVLVESLEQVGVMLEARHDDETARDRGAAIHFITGPSRNADIELTLSRGVHGPREVHAIFVETPFRG